MSTRSRIGVLVNGKIESVYCHFDGFPCGDFSVGQILLKHYYTQEKIQQLIDLGDISYLREEIGEKHDFDDISKNKIWTKFYKRDRGDLNCAKQISATKLDYLDIGSNSCACFLYLYVPSEFQWYYIDTREKEWRYLSNTAQYKAVKQPI